MTDTDGLLSEKIADLERQLAESQENGVQLLKLCSQKTNEIAKAASLRKKLGAKIHNQRVSLHYNSMWRDTVKKYGRKIQAQDAEISDLKHDLDAVIDQQLESLSITLRERNTEIADLKKGFIDVDVGFEKDARITRLEQAIHNTLETGMTLYIEEVMEKHNE